MYVIYVESASGAVLYVIYVESAPGDKFCSSEQFCTLFTQSPHRGSSFVPYLRRVHTGGAVLYVIYVESALGGAVKYVIEVESALGARLSTLFT